MTNSQVPEQIKFWKWVNSTTLALVGVSSVYHVSIKNVSGFNNKVEAKKICSREGALKGLTSPV